MRTPFRRRGRLQDGALNQCKLEQYSTQARTIFMDCASNKCSCPKVCTVTMEYFFAKTALMEPFTWYVCHRRMVHSEGTFLKSIFYFPRVDFRYNGDR